MAGPGRPPLPEAAGRPDPSEGGPAFYWAAAMARLHGWGFLQALGRNAAAVVSYREAAERVAGGRAAVSGGLSGEAVWREGRKGKPVVLGVPAEGVPAIPAATGLPKGAAHPNAGALFLSFLLSPAAQRVLAGDGFYPALVGEAPPAGRVALEKLRLLQLPWERTARRGEALRRRLRRSLAGGASPPGSAANPKGPGVGRASSRPRPRSSLEARVRKARLPGVSHPCGWFGS
ncbi:MAG: ABC transporter substrate-binding protein [Nitrospinota bacterium]